MDSADILLEKIFSWVNLQKQSAEELKKLATELEEHNKNINISKVVGSSASVGGAAAITVAGVAAVCTGGLALPFVAVAGAVASGLGLATNLGSRVVSAFISSNTMKEAKKISEEIESLGKEIQEHVKTLSTETKARRKGVSSEDYVMERILRAIAKRNGLNLKDNDVLITLVSNMQLKKVFKEDLNSNILKEAVQLSEFVKWASSQSIGHMSTFHIENLGNCETEASITLREQAETIETTSKEMESELEEIGELCQTVANMKWKKYR